MLELLPRSRAPVPSCSVDSCTSGRGCTPGAHERWIDVVRSLRCSSTVPCSMCTPDRNECLDLTPLQRRRSYGASCELLPIPSASRVPRGNELAPL